MVREVTVAALLGTLVACATNNSKSEGESAVPPASAAPTLAVTSTRVFDAPVERVWRAWAERAEVMRWWGPQGFTTPVADMDFREGGSSFVCMRAPEAMGGVLLCNTWTYRTIEPRARIEFTLHFTDADRRRLDPSAMPGMPPGIPNGVPHVLTFRAVDANRTAMTLVESGYTTPEARDQSKAGLEQVLDKLAASLAR